MEFPFCKNLVASIVRPKGFFLGDNKYESLIGKCGD